MVNQSHQKLNHVIQKNLYFPKNWIYNYIKSFKKRVWKYIFWEHICNKVLFCIGSNLWSSNLVSSFFWSSNLVGSFLWSSNLVSGLNSKSFAQEVKSKNAAIFLAPSLLTNSLKKKIILAWKSQNDQVTHNSWSHCYNLSETQKSRWFSDNVFLS